MKKLKLGKVQMKIMDVLWEKKRASALEITESINKTDSIKHSTVQTCMRMLLDKELIKYDVENRTFVYYPTVNDHQVKQYAINELAEQAFQGSIKNLVSYILKNEKIDKEEYDDIWKEIKNKKK